MYDNFQTLADINYLNLEMFCNSELLNIKDYVYGNQEMLLSRLICKTAQFLQLKQNHQVKSR